MRDWLGKSHEEVAVLLSLGILARDEELPR